MKFKRQMIEAAIWTFVETFLATLVPAIAVIQVGDWNALVAPAASAGVAALAAAFSLIKSTVVKNIGDPESIFISTE